MALYLVGYDLNKQGQDYTDLIKAIKILGNDTWCHCLDSTWIIPSDLSAVEIRDNLSRHIDGNDELLVVLLGDSAAWQLKTECSDWLMEMLS